MIEPRISPQLPDWIKEHLKNYLASNGENGHMWDATLGGGTGMVPTLLLTTIGRKSGVALTLPLIYGQRGNAYVVIASKGGAPAHPAWYLNLQANPEVGLQVKAERFNARARTATGAERAALWQQLVEIYHPYGKYQVTAGAREIPVVVLDPV
ncbi:MAG: nitroreductase family deazaflavin-dependent oxidoreductase [Gammaproteobacteria bacterium]|nr:nitroreductase family deazaflavin-dependent oxidoreductase [Gammaproteobacteria bacterium]MBK8306052.1 nitroreductase family deazaflavin-dependent oxidoreductase [Gammaproteobacteria bacterium]